jgi:hypothetical protein
MFDKLKAVKLQREALEIYERLNDSRGQAMCLFSLAIQESDRDVSHACAMRSAVLYRSANDHTEAARAITLALMYWPKGGPLQAERELAEQGLKDAQIAGSRSNEKIFYSHLSRISARQGNFEEADQFRRWEKENEDSDGLTPEERRRDEIEFAKSMIETAKKMGNANAVKMFEGRLREVKKSKTQ